MNQERGQPLDLPYTIGFCTFHDTVLMLHRKFPPNQYLWNGIGGKIAAGESPDAAIAREIMEESHLDVHKAESVNYVGIVTWTVVQDAANHHKGMYAYIIRFNDGIDWHNKLTKEGLLEWKPLNWVIDTANREVVDNIPHFLPLMLEAVTPVRYHCHYAHGDFEKLSLLPLET